MCTISPKIGINTTNNEPINYLDIVIPSSDTNNSINVANSFGSGTVFYTDKNGNVSLNGALMCAEVIVRESGVSLPITYASLPGSTDIGCIMTGVPSASINMNFSNFSNICNVTIPTGVWLFNATSGFNSASMPNSSIQSIQLTISSVASSGGFMGITYPVDDFTFGTTNSSTLYMTLGSPYVNTDPSDTIYLTSRIYGVGTLQSVIAGTSINALRIA